MSRRLDKENVLKNCCVPNAIRVGGRPAQGGGPTGRDSGRDDRESVYSKCECDCRTLNRNQFS